MRDPGLVEDAAHVFRRELDGRPPEGSEGLGVVGRVLLPVVALWVRGLDRENRDGSGLEDVHLTAGDGPLHVLREAQGRLDLPRHLSDGQGEALVEPAEVTAHPPVADRHVDPHDLSLHQRPRRAPGVAAMRTTSRAPVTGSALKATPAQSAGTSRWSRIAIVAHGLVASLRLGAGIEAAPNGLEHRVRPADIEHGQGGARVRAGGAVLPRRRRPHRERTTERRLGSADDGAQRLGSGPRGQADGEADGEHHAVGDPEACGAEPREACGLGAGNAPGRPREDRRG